MTEKREAEIVEQLLSEAGFQKLSVAEQLGVQEQGEKTLLLESVLRRQLALINSVEINSVREERFSRQGIEAGIRALKELALLEDRSVRRKRSYELLTRGKVFTQYVAGDKVNYTMQYVDWQNPMRNVFHMAQEMRIEGRNKLYRPDVVLFVNGIPLCVVEVKGRTGCGNERWTAQQLKAEGNNGAGGVWDTFTQLWVTSVNGRIRYTADGNGDYPWAEWSGEEAEFSRTVFWQPGTLLSLIGRFIIFHGENKTVARYFQYVAVQRMLQRIACGTKGERSGGIIAQPPGSGKTGTMALLARAVLLEKSVRNPGILLVTDRKTVSEEISNLLAGMEIPLVTGEDAYKLAVFQDSEESVATVVTAQSVLVNELLSARSVADRDIFVLFDEGGSVKSRKVKRQLQQVFPDACYIAMTSLPQTEFAPIIRSFGEVVMRYTMEEAVKDALVLPVFYESRLLGTAGQDLYSQSFAGRNMTDLSGARIKVVGEDIAGHFQRHFKGTSCKGIVICGNQTEACLLKHFFDQDGRPEAGLLIAGAGTEGGAREAGGSRVSDWELIRRFREEQGPRLLITVKRFVGLDIPCCAVAYVLRPVKAAELWQIAGRVNRIRKGKRYGMLVDYAGLSGEVREVLHSRKAENDSLISEERAFRLLDHYNGAAWDSLGGFPGKNGIGEAEVKLRDEERRAEFYHRLKNYANCLDIVRTSWMADRRECGAGKGYSADMKFFLSLQRALQKRFSEEIKDDTYEDILRHLAAEGVIPDELALPPECAEITESERFDQELEGDELAVADTIFYRTRKYIRQHKEDMGLAFPGLLEKLEEIQSVFEQEGDAGQYLRAVKELMAYVRTYRRNGLPPVLNGKTWLQRYYKIVMKLIQPVLDQGRMEQQTLEIVRGVDEIVRRHIMDGEVVLVDWHLKGSVCGSLTMELEDYLFTKVNQELGIPLTEKVVEESAALLVGATRDQNDK